jgi:taurine transport system permease protein
MKRKKSSYDILMDILPVISIVTFILLWFYVARITGYRIASPMQVAARFQTTLKKPIASKSIFQHAGISLLRVVKALFFAIVIGIPLGLLMGWNRTFRAIVRPVFEAIRPIPPIAWIPLITMWFGIYETPKVIIIFLGTFTPIVVNTYTGVSMVPQLNTDAGRSFGADSMQLLKDIVIPSAFPSIFAGIRTAISSGWVVMLAAEMISAKSGLGFLVIRGQEVSDYPLILLAMVFIGVIGAALSLIFNRIERWLCPWTEK